MTNAATRVPSRLRAGARAHPWWTVGVVVVLCAAAGGSYWTFGTSSGDPAASNTLSRTVSAGIGTIRESITTTGTIEPAEQEELNFGASGVVTAVHVAQGDTVHKDQVLATIDSASLQASLAEAKAGLAGAQARVASDNDSSTTTSTQLSADEAAVTAAQGQVSSAQSALADASLISPIDGVVSAVNLSVGQQVSGASSSNAGRNADSGSGGTGSGNGGSANGGSGNGGSGNGGSGSTGSSAAQVEVIGTSSWIADATVDSTQLGQVKPGLQVQLTLDGATTPIFGTIGSVGVLPTSGSSPAAYPVTVNVTGSPAGVHAGASATVAIVYKQLNDVLTVPSLAVRSSNGKSVVTVVSGGKQSSRTVTTGASSGGEVQITSGLTSGEQVLVQVSIPGGTGRSGTSGTTRTGNGRFGGGFGGGGFGGGGVFPGGGGGFPAGGGGS